MKRDIQTKRSKSEMLFVVLLLLAALSCGADTIEWKSFDEGLEEMKQMNKPGVVLIHHSTCPACINLGKIFATSKKVINLSRSFVMISCSNGFVPVDPAYNGGISCWMKNCVDGSYVPRLFFVSPAGKVLTEITAVQGDSRYKYYYYSENQLVQSMQLVSHNKYLRILLVCRKCKSSGRMSSRSERIRFEGISPIAFHTFFCKWWTLSLSRNGLEILSFI